MLRPSLIAICVAALVTTAAPAGELKFHAWPVAYVPVEVVDIPVVMDVGFWVDIVNQDDVIKLQQVSIHRYEGCLDLEVHCNFDLTLNCSIVSTGAIVGKYACSLLDPDIDVPGGTATVCAQLVDADLDGQPGGSRDVHVATVTITVVPRR